MARDYRKEYDNYHSSSKQKKNRAGRTLARRMMKKRVAINGKDVHHQHGNPPPNSTSNLAITSKSYNRSRNA